MKVNLQIVHLSLSFIFSHDVYCFFFLLPLGLGGGRWQQEHFVLFWAGADKILGRCTATLPEGWALSVYLLFCVFLSFFLVELMCFFFFCLLDCARLCRSRRGDLQVRTSQTPNVPDLVPKNITFHTCFFIGMSLPFVLVVSGGEGPFVPRCAHVTLRTTHNTCHGRDAQHLCILFYDAPHFE